MFKLRRVLNVAGTCRAPYNIICALSTSNVEICYGLRMLRRRKYRKPAFDASASQTLTSSKHERPQRERSRPKTPLAIVLAGDVGL